MTEAARVEALKREENLGYIVRVAHRAFVRELSRELAPHGIGSVEWSVLRALWREDGLSQVEIADRLNVEKASLTPVLRSLEKKGHLSRTRSGSDRRKMVVQLTPSGDALRDVLLPVGAVAVEQRAARGIAKRDLATFRAVLAHIVDNLSDEVTSPGRDADADETAKRRPATRGTSRNR